MCIEGGNGNEEGLGNRVGFTKRRQVLSIKKKKKAQIGKSLSWDQDSGTVSPEEIGEKRTRVW